MRTVRITDAVYRHLVDRKRGNMTFDDVVRQVLRDAYPVGMKFEDDQVNRVETGQGNVRG